MLNALARVDSELLGAVDALSGRYEHLANPIGRDGEVGRIRPIGYPFAAPARKVRNQNVGAEVELGLMENQPATGTVDAELKRTRNQGAERRGCANMPEHGLRRRVKVAAENLGHEILGDGAKTR